MTHCPPGRLSHENTRAAISRRTWRPGASEKSTAKQPNHFIEGQFDMRGHRLARFTVFVRLDGANNLAMADPSGDSLCAQRIETADVAERQAKLIDHALIARHFGQAQVKSLVRH